MRIGEELEEALEADLEDLVLDGMPRQGLEAHLRKPEGAGEGLEDLGGLESAAGLAADQLHGRFRFGVLALEAPRRLAADELEGLEEKALKTGASKLYIEDLKDEWERVKSIPAERSNFINKQLNVFTMVDELSFLDIKTIKKKAK